LTAAEADLSGCARYPSHTCKAMFWTAGQRYDVAGYKLSSFVWKSTPGTGSCCGEGTCMSEMGYTHWAPNEPNNAEGLDASLNVASSPLPEKCVQLCSGWQYKWNDAVCEIPTCSICEYDVQSSDQPAVSPGVREPGIENTD